MDDLFNYCVGVPWPNGEGLCIYAYGGQVRHGTIDDAKEFREYVDEVTERENFIYKLVKVEE